MNQRMLASLAMRAIFEPQQIPCRVSSCLKWNLILGPLGHIVPLDLRLSVRSIAGDLAGDDLGDVAIRSLSSSAR